MKRDLTRRGHSAHVLDAMARVTTSDVEHARESFRRDAPRWAKGLLELPAYEGDGVPSDATRDP